MALTEIKAAIPRPRLPENKKSSEEEKRYTPKFEQRRRDDGLSLGTINSFILGYILGS